MQVCHSLYTPPSHHLTMSKKLEAMEVPATPSARHRLQLSPERTVVWKEPPVKHRKQPVPPRNVPIVYYLYRNHQLDQPHFMEVPLASTNGLYLRGQYRNQNPGSRTYKEVFLQGELQYFFDLFFVSDVDFIEHLTLLRGKGMPTMYSWSCKRSYKNRFVWQDLAEDDLVIPAHGDDYILKGTEFADHSSSDRLDYSPVSLQLQNLKRRSPTSSLEANSSSSSHDFIVMEAKHILSRQEHKHKLSPTYCQSSQDLVESKVHKPKRWTDASTQTEEERGRNACEVSICKRNVSTEDEVFDLNFSECDRNRTPYSNEESVDGMDEISLAPISSTASSPFPKMDTLEALIRAEARRMNGQRIFDEDVPVHMKLKQKAIDMLLQMITCGLVPKKDHHDFGLIQTYKHRVSDMMVPSTMLSSSMMLREFDLSENVKVRELRQEDRKYYNVRPGESKPRKEEEREGKHTLNHSSCSYEDRTRGSPDSLWIEQKIMNLTDSKLPQSTKLSSCKLSSDASNMSVWLKCRPVSSSKTGSRRVTDSCSMEESSMRLGSFKQ